jgi:hypothetical protein
MTEGGSNTLSRANALSRNVFVLYTLMRDLGRCIGYIVAFTRCLQDAGLVEEDCA